MADRQVDRGLSTTAIHAGESPNPLTGATAPDIVMSTTFTVDPEVSFSAENITDETPYVYTRWGNPTIDQLERKIAALEATEDATVFASGVAAANAVLFSTLNAGDHLIMSDVTYAAVSEFTNEKLPQLGIEVSRVDTSDIQNIVDALRPNTKLVYLESPANPLIRLTDVAAVTKIAHQAGALVAVDSTFATPIGFRGSSFDVDFVIQSLTKYICGHGDALGGSVAGSHADITRLRSAAIHNGGVISPFNAWLILRGATTLPVRLKAHEAGALAVSQWLEKDSRIKRVIYPGLPSHPQYELAKRQLDNFSGMLTFQTVDPGPKVARRLADNLQVIHYAVSLGHQRSLVCWIGTDDMLQSSFHLTPKQEESYRAYAGDGIFRLSVGLEDPEDLIADLDNALG